MLRVYVTDPVTTTETAYTARLRPDRRFEVGAQVFRGEPDQSSFLLDDAFLELDWETEFAAGRKVRLTEDASGSEKTLIVGRIKSKEFERGTLPQGRQLAVTIEDANTDLTGIPIHNWVRPAETGRVRALAVRSGFLNGSSSTVLNPLGGRYARDSTVIASTYMQNAGNLTMPAETYDATDPINVLAACAEFENKRLGVYVNDNGTLALYYAPKTETAQLNCTVGVSDDPADESDPDYFEPHWIAGPALHTDADELLTGGLLIHPTGTTYDRRAASENVHDRWEEAIYSQLALAEGTVELDSLLDARTLEQPRRQFAIQMPAAQVHLVKAGMRIEVKKADASAIDASTFFRIVNVRYAWLSPDEDHTYNVIVTLETPVKVGSTWPRGVPSQFRRAVGGATTGSATYEPANSWIAQHLVTIPVTDISWQNGLTAGAIYPALFSNFYGDDSLAGRFRDRTFMSWLVNAGTRATAGMGGTWYISTSNSYTGTYTWQLVSSYWGTGQPLTIEPEGHIVASGSFTNTIGGEQFAIGTFEVPITSGRVQLYLRTNFPDNTQQTRVWIRGLLASPTHINTGFVQIDTPSAYYGESYGPVPVAVADGVTSSWTLPYPAMYKAGTLNVEVDGIWQVVSEDDPATGLFSLGWTPGAGDQISATWRVPSV